MPEALNFAPIRRLRWWPRAGCLPRRLLAAALVSLLAGGSVQAVKPPDMFVADTDMSGAGSFKEPPLTTELSLRLSERYPCGDLSDAPGVRLRIGEEKFKSLMGTGGASGLAEIGGALGKDLIVTSALRVLPGSGGFASFSITLLNPRKATMVATARATAPWPVTREQLQKLVRQAVEGLPDWCGTVWGGTIVHTYRESISSSGTQEAGDSRIYGSTDHQLVITTTIQWREGDDESQSQESTKVQVSGGSEVVHRRVSGALCPGERVVPDGYRDESRTLVRFLASDEPTTPAGVLLNREPGSRYTLSVKLPAVKYVAAPQMRHSITECGREIARNNVTDADARGSQTWSGSYLTFRGVLSDNQESIEGSFQPDRPAAEGVKSSESWRWSFKRVSRYNITR